jgi:predicted lipoprotein with Yx(FWY)xxD motif
MAMFALPARSHFAGVAALIVLTAAAPSVAGDAPEAPAGVTFERSAAGWTFVTPDGRPLYWSRDELGAKTITCVEKCLTTRHPLTAPADTTPPRNWAIVARPDGGRQWAYRGKPLYTSVDDTFPGARLGASASWLLTFEATALPASFTLQNTLVGRVLADHKGRTLYTMTKPGGDSWLPVIAPWLASAGGEWTLEPLADGARQWAYGGERLYLNADDEDPQDLRGHGVDGAHAVILEPPPGTPAWMTIQRADLGWVFADRHGMTVYAPDTAQQIETAQTCPASCMAAYWRPVLADPEEKPVGRWTIVATASGERQWTFNGQPLYTHTRDAKPGDIVGNSFAVGYSIGDGFRVIPIQSNLPPAI